MTEEASLREHLGVGVKRGTDCLDTARQHEPHFSTPLHGCRIMRGYHFTVEGCCLSTIMRLLQLTPLHSGLFSKLDDDDYDLAVQWIWESVRGGSKNHVRRYASRRVQVNHARIRISLHRWIMNAPIGMDVDHINGDSLDNQRSNLRIATRAQNVGNQAPPSRSVHGFFGVYNKRPGKWYARIVVNQHFINIGVFPSAIEAALAYDQKAKEIRGPITHLNFPNGI